MPSAAIASSNRLRCPIGTTPISLRSSDVRRGNTLASISFARNASSYCSSPRPRSHAAMSTLASLDAVTASLVKLPQILAARECRVACRRHGHAMHYGDAVIGPFGARALRGLYDEPGPNPVLAPLGDVGSGSWAAVVARLMVPPVCPQLRNCRVRPGSYAWCHNRTSLCPRFAAGIRKYRILFSGFSGFGRR